MSDLRAAVEGLHDPVCACPGDGSDPDCNWHPGSCPVLALIPEGAVLAQVLPDDTVCACLHETGERKVRRYDRCERCGAFMVADEGAVLVTYGEHGENDARHHYDLRCQVCGESGSVTVVIEPQYVLRHLREGT